MLSCLLKERSESRRKMYYLTYLEQEKAKTERHIDSSYFSNYASNKVDVCLSIALENDKQKNTICESGYEITLRNDKLFAKCVFFNRELHKETDEYITSVEAELAARQREIQNQAKDAQHLKRLQKRKREKSKRSLDMERRLKLLRIEEMHRSQKKEEEILSLKEELRAEVSKHLNELETTCNDMPSILSGLGINVNGENGVHAALRKAWLTFHPDRVSQSDIRQQVEAEEKFKLITRMKEKFMSTL